MILIQLCRRCRTKEATIHFSHKVDGRASVDADLCEECAKPLLTRQEALRQGPHACELCGEDAFSPLPGIRRLAYACCGCRNRYREIFFELCAEQRPNLLERSERDLSFFELCFDPEIEDWADLAGKRAMQKLKHL